MNLFSISVDLEAVAASTAETLLQVVAASTKSIELVRWGVSFNGTNPDTGPVKVDLMRFTSVGTSSAFTPLKLDPTSDAALAAGRTAFTAEPVSADILERHLVASYNGLLVMQYAPDERIRVAADGTLGIRVLAQAAVNATAFFVFAE
jgi:hypothetical protein